MKSRKKAPTPANETNAGQGCTSIREIVEQIERNFLEGETTPTATELVRLLELQKELASQETKHIEVRWVEAMADRGQRGIKYSPLPSQKLFHDSQARFKGFSGPIGSGKSAALCQEAIRLSYLNPGRTGLIGAPTYPMLRDSTLAALLETLDDNEIPFELNKADNVLTMKDTGSRILLRSVDEFERLRGTNLAWFGLDELTYTQEGAWLRLEGRLRDPKATRRCGFAVWTPKGFDWVYRKFIAESGSRVTKRFRRNRLRTVFCWSRCRIFTSGCAAVTTRHFYRQEVLGDYLNVQRRAGVSRVRPREERAGDEGGSGAAGCLGAGFQRGPDVFGGGAGGSRRRSLGAG